MLNDHPPIFIVGAPRSGTTLLRSFLAASDEIAIPPESHFLVYLFHRYRGRLDRWAPADTTRLLRDVVIDAHFLDWKLPAGLVWAEAEREPPTSFAEAITCPHRAYARRERKRWWGDKTPHYLFALAELDEMFPDMRVVHLVRDGRDVACSHLDLRRKGEGWVAPSTPAVAAWWRESLRTARRLAPRFGDRYLELRYEDLVAEPERWVQALCQFARLTYSQSMITERSRRIVVSDDPIFARANQAIDRKARNWRDELSPAQVVQFEAVAGADLERYGYELSGIHGSMLERTAARLRGESFMTWRTARRWSRQQAHRYAKPVARSKQRLRTRTTRARAGEDAA